MIKTSLHFPYISRSCSHLPIVEKMRTSRPSGLGPTLAALFCLLSFLSVSAASTNQTKWIEATDASGHVIYLDDARKPALYTQNFGDCLGNSLINVTRFDAAYYQDNGTVLFHLEGNTAVANESIMSILWSLTKDSPSC